MEDERRFTRLWSFCYGKTMAIIGLFLNTKVLNNGSFVDFLNKFKHEMFHQWIPRVQCCQCSVQSFHSFHRNAITEPQMISMYDLKGNVIPGHEKKNNRGEITKHCLCKISAKPDVSTYDVDIGTIHCILRTCANNLFMRVQRHIVSIKEVRNYLAHSTDRKIAESTFNQKWTELETAILSIAYDIGPSHKVHEAQQITQLKGTDISREEIIGILDTMNEENRKQWEDKFKNIKEQEAIQHCKTSAELETLCCKIKNLELVISRYEIHNSTQTNEHRLRSWKCCACFFCEQHDQETVLIKWTIETPDSWNLQDIKNRLQSNVSKFGIFIIKFVYLGSLIIGTTVARQITENHDQFKSEIFPFFTQLVEVCRIDVDTPAVISVYYTVDENPDDEVITENQSIVDTTAATDYESDESNGYASLTSLTKGKGYAWQSKKVI